MKNWPARSPSNLHGKLGQSVLDVFSDGEIRFQSHENVRGADVFIVQSLCQDSNFHIMELLLMADAFKRASARRITAVITYYAYARQDRKDRPAGRHLGAPARRPAGNGRLFAGS